MSRQAEKRRFLIPSAFFLMPFFCAMTMSGQSLALTDEGSPKADPILGGALYGANCSMCHDTGEGEAPRTEALRKLLPERILAAMSEGVMVPQAEHLSEEHRWQIAHYLGKIDSGAVQSNKCSSETMSGAKTSPVYVSNWGHGEGNQRFAAKSQINSENVASLELDWVFAYPDAARARTQPTVAGNTVYTAGQSGVVFALDMNSGCVLWQYQAEAEVRSAISIDVGPQGEAVRLYFGDFEGSFYGFDINERQLIWKRRVDAHPAATVTGSAILNEDTIYVPVSSREVVSAVNPDYECCTFRGAVLALNKHTGEQVWKTRMVAKPQVVGENSEGTPSWGPSGAPIWSSPTIDVKRGLLYVGTGENYSHPTSKTSDAIVAMSLRDGAISWINQVTKDDAWNGSCGRPNPANCPENRGPDYDFGAPPILVTTKGGKDVILAGQKSGRVYAMDPDNDGKLLWDLQVGRGGIMGGVHWGMATDGLHVYVPVSDISVYAYDAHKPPQSGLHAVDIETGNFVWRTLTKNICGDAKWRCSPGLSAAVSQSNDIVLGGGLDGMVRAFSAETGAILWEFSTNRPFMAANGAIAEGGSLDSDGPVIVGDRMFVTSGYDKWGQKFGNVLLSFKLNKKPAGQE